MTDSTITEAVTGEEGIAEVPSGSAPPEAHAGADRSSAPARRGANAPLLGSIDRISDVAMEVRVELGRAEMAVRELLELRAGSIVELNRPVGSPADVLVNGKLIARGEVVVIDEEFGVRITELVGGDESEAQA